MRKKISILIITVTLSFVFIINACLSGDESFPSKPTHNPFYTLKSSSSSSSSTNSSQPSSSTFNTNKTTNYTNFSTIPNKRKKFAVLAIGTADTNVVYHDNLDPIDQNVCWITTVKLYTYLKESGFKDYNIYFLYCKGNVNPDFSDERLYETSQYVKNYHFTGKYNNDYTTSNLESIIDNKIIPKMDEESIFIFYTLTHGDMFTNTIILPGNNYIGPNVIGDILQDIPSKRNLAIYLACYSGDFKTNLSHFAEFNPAQPNSPLWIDNNLNPGESYIRNKIDFNNDVNDDELIDYYEAFNAVKKEANDYEEYWRNYCENYYGNPPLGKECGSAARITPYNVTVGKDYIPFNLGE